VPAYPNTAFRNENAADRFWAAKKIQAFTDDEIRAIVSTGRYSDPLAAEWVARCLIERRNKIVRAFAKGVTALDRFDVRNGWLEFRNRAPEAIDLADIHVQWATYDNETGRKELLAHANSFELPRAPGAKYLLAHITGKGAGSASIYVSLNRDTPRVIGVERLFKTHKKD
jgi:hypothetical protein